MVVGIGYYSLSPIWEAGDTAPKKRDLTLKWKSANFGRLKIDPSVHENGCNVHIINPGRFTPNF